MHRRLVTVLFIDAAGSTRLSQQLDPEDIHAVLDGLLAQAAALVQAHEGRVLQFTGDGLLAAFGTGQAREDDTERAVRCALALAALGAQAGAAVQSRHGFEGFGLRAGVHLGVVLLGGGVDEAGTIRGMAVNVAARLEQAAPTAGVRISHEAWRLVRGSFDTRALPPLQAKPGEPRLASWLVLGEKPPAQQTRVRGVDGLATPLVGRSAELAALRAALQRAQAGTLQVLHVVAEAGLGKSRLRAEVRARDRPALAVCPAPERDGAPGPPAAALQPAARPAGALAGAGRRRIGPGSRGAMAACAGALAGRAGNA